MIRALAAREFTDSESEGEYSYSSGSSDDGAWEEEDMSFPIAEEAEEEGTAARQSSSSVGDLSELTDVRAAFIVAFVLVYAQ